nr:hypothetical protein [Tanacetum cinerariifolium]
MAHSNPRGFIYQNKEKKNRLMRIDELHKFSDMTLNDVRNALDDRLKGIRMQYFPSTIWRKGDKDRAAAMIQAIDKMLKTRRIMRSLEKFIGGRLSLEDQEKIKIEFAYDYGNLNASYVNEKINFDDDYFQEIINPDFEKIDSPFQQTSSLKPYVPNVILKKIIIDLKDEVVNLLEKEKSKLGNN